MVIVMVIIIMIMTVIIKLIIEKNIYIRSIRHANKLWDYNYVIFWLALKYCLTFCKLGFILKI